MDNSVSTGLTDWLYEPDLNQLKADLQQAKQSQSKHIANINYWEKLYNAPKFGNESHKGSRINPKLIRKQAEWAIPALSEPFLSTNSLFEVKPITFDDVDRAKQNALILNRQFNTQINKTKLVDDIIRQLVKKGTAIVRCGWEYQEKEVIEDIEQFEYTQVQDPNYQQILQSKYQEIQSIQQQEPDTYEQLPSDIKAGFEMSLEKGILLEANSLGFKKERITKPIVNKPTVEVCDIRNIYIDPTCKSNLDKAQFIIHGYESSLSDLKKSGKYKNLDKLTQSIYNNDDSYSGQSEFKFTDKARRKLVVYEYWGYWDIDGKGMTTPIVATWCNDIMLSIQENPFPDSKPPFVIFNYLPEEDSLYGIPNAELLGDNQEILGAITRGMIDLMGKSANSQTGFAKNYLDATNKTKFLKGMDYEYNQGFDPRVHVYTHKYPEIPNSALHMVQMMNNEAESLSGVKAFSGTGISASNLGDVAVGVRGVLDAVSKREMSILRRISHGFKILGRKIMSMNSVFLSEQEIVRITNDQFITVRRDDLLGEFDVSLSISTAEADEAKAQELSFMLQTIGNTLGQEVTQMILSQIAQLRKMPDLAKAIENYKPEPNELEQKLQELEIAKLEAQIALIQAEAKEREAKSQVQSAKVSVEHAKAENLQGDADNKALDFLERDSGIHHQRQLEKQELINTGLDSVERLKADNKLQLENQRQEQQLVNKFLDKELNNDFL